MKVFVLCLLAAAVAAESPVYREPYESRPKYVKEEYVTTPEPPKPYNFGYNVKDDEKYTDYQRQEASDGKVIKGSYRVALPDGRIQTVNYVAGPEGTVADVTYEGEAWYPPEPAPAPYKKDEYVPKAEYPAAPAYPQKPVYKQPEYPQPSYKKDAYEPVPVYQPKKY